MTTAVPDIIARLRQATGAADDADLARRLRLSSRAVVSNWKRRDTVPLSECLQVARDQGVSLDWLLLGRGAMRLERRGELRDGDSTPYVRVGPAKPPPQRRDPATVVHAAGCPERLRRWQQWQAQWWRAASPDEQAWMEIQLRRAFPEYAAEVTRGLESGNPRPEDQAAPDVQA